MNLFDSIRQNRSFFFRCINFVFFVQIVFGILVLMISPVTAATDPPLGSDPRIEWVKSFGPIIEDGSFSIIAASDGGAVAAGNIKSPPGSSSFYIIKTDTNGNKLWDQTETVIPNEICSIIETSDKGYVVVESSNSSIANGILLQKFDPSGKKIWSQVFKKGEYYHGNYISTTRDGGFIITGSVYRNPTPPSSLWDGYILKTDSEGRELWTGFFMGEKNDFANFIRQTEDGGYIIAGTTESYGGIGGPYTFLLKMNEFGNKEWFTTYENGLGNEKPSVVQMPDGGYILMGTSLPVIIDQGYQDLFLVRTDDHGKELWKKKYSGRGRTTGNLLIQETDGIAVIAGNYQGSDEAKTSEIILLEIDLNGNETRNRTFSFGQSIDIKDIAVIPGKGYFVTGLLKDQENPIGRAHV